jgi:hypothetical protein
MPALLTDFVLFSCVRISRYRAQRHLNATLCRMEFATTRDASCRKLPL